MSDFDYIIVGGGAAGCALAARLAEGLPQERILLLDAGGQNKDQSLQSFAERHWTLTAPGYNWGYKTIPQEDLNKREIDSSKGKGLGGSTAINFCVYTRGPSADFDHWAQLVGDNTWSWENSLPRFKKIETFHEAAPGFEEFATISAATHGKDGPVDVGVAEVWDPGFGDFMRNAYHYHPKNLDHNSGDPLGISVCQLSAHGGKRVTASGAYLTSNAPNLTITTDTAVTKIIIEDGKAVGVEVDERQMYAKKEIVLTAGAIDSPKLLLLSGIGPARDLQTLKIPVIQDLPGVGKNLQDRLFLELVTVQKPDSHHRTSYIDSPDALEQARNEWTSSHSGPLSDYYLPQMIGYFKSDNVVASQEFADLDNKTQHLYNSKTKPLYEVISQNPSPSVKAPEKYLATAVAFPGNYGAGEIKLSSSNPSDLPLIDPKYLAHPFDKRLAIESVRETMEFLKQPLMTENSLRFAAGPDGMKDEEILKYVRNTAISMWHNCGTVRMGKVGEEGTCVDKDFKVVGVQKLRVADMSIAPFLPSAHLQAVAYLVGETAAEKIIDEHHAVFQ